MLRAPTRINIQESPVQNAFYSKQTLEPELMGGNPCKFLAIGKQVVQPGKVQSPYEILCLTFYKKCYLNFCVFNDMIHTHSTGTPGKMPFSEALKIRQRLILNIRTKMML